MATNGDGSVGIQVSRPMEALSVSGDVITSGGEGLSLVKGVQLVLEAVGLSIKPGADVGSITVGAKIATTGDDVTTVEIEGHLGRLAVAGGIHADGTNSDAVHVFGELVGLDAIELHASNGQKLVRTS